VTAQLRTAPVPVADAGFTCSADGARWSVAGALTFATAGPALARAQALPLPATGVVECGGITAADSAAVALLLAVRRRAAAQGARLAFTGVPAALASLAALYGVEEMLGG
jgi:phospholipid transport system transporter-binding protein